MSIRPNASNSPCRRSDILDAALDCFVSQGYDRATIDEIRRRSGASVGSIYHHFGGKAELAATLYSEILISYQQELVALLRSKDDPQLGVTASVKHYLGWVAAYPDAARYLYNFRGPTKVEDRVKAANRDMFTKIQRWADPFVAADRFPKAEPDLLFSLWFGGAQEFARLWLAGRTRLGLVDVESVIARAAWKSVRSLLD